jgi:zinc transporter 1/2/3
MSKNHFPGLLMILDRTSAICHVPQNMSDCDPGNEYDGRLGLRISSIFTILVGSFLGAVLPLCLSSTSLSKKIRWLLFGAKFFGSGVIVATAFIHVS